MNYYRRYMGDYAAGTAHLSITEHGAYGLLLDAYYAREGPFPLDVDLCRLCRATTPAERRAVQRVADEFFPIDGDVRRNSRCDKELALAIPRIEAARSNGRLGGRPPKTQSVTQRETQPVTQSGTHLESSPTTNPQPPSAIRQPRERARGIPKGWYESEAGIREAAKVVGVKARPGESWPNFKARVEAAVSTAGGE